MRIEAVTIFIYFKTERIVPTKVKIQTMRANQPQYLGIKNKNSKLLAFDRAMVHAVYMPIGKTRPQDRGS